MVSSSNNRFDDYREQWQRYRKLRNLFMWIFLGYFPVVFAFTVIVSKLFHSLAPGFLLAGGWMLALVVVGTRLSEWWCPRCGKWYSATWGYNKGFFARKCVNCGLLKYADSSFERVEP
jgi:hypothetical protein